MCISESVLNWEMRIQQWAKMFKRKPFTGVVLSTVLLLAFITICRLKQESPEEKHVTHRARTYSPVELSWPLPLSSTGTSKKLEAMSTKMNHKPVNEEQLKRLRKIHPLLDTNSDSYVSVEELKNWILSKVKEHIQGALRENIFLFTSIDSSPRNGQISWKEYYVWYLKKQGINNTVETVENDVEKGLDRVVKEKIAWDKAAWTEAARTDPDYLNLDEFLSFRHPESSHTSLLNKADDLLAEYDRDGDDLLTWEEYSSIPSDSLLVRYSGIKKKDEFVNHIDKDRDGKLDKKEILSYLDPRNPRHAHLEAESLVQLSDGNEDGKLSKDEILAAADLFLASKVIDIETYFHDEF